jgi:release factor glutamine methyltransferase
VTIRILLKEAAKELEDHGIDSPRYTSELLLSHILGMKRIEIYLDLDRKILREEREKFSKALRKRLGNEPTSYIIGETGFMGLTLRVQKGVFIPRPETESLCEAVFKRLEETDPPTPKGLRRTGSPLPAGRQAPTAGYPPETFTIFEIGCGCGSISLALAKYFSDKYKSDNNQLPITNYNIFASDISEIAILNAEENSKILGFYDKVQFLKGNLFEPFRSLQQKADLVISNPPYIPSPHIDGLQKEIREFEPREAIDGGDDGLYFLKKIVDGSSYFLKVGGILALEVGTGQAYPLKEYVTLRNGYQDVEIFKDLSGMRRGIIAIK